MTHHHQQHNEDNTWNKLCSWCIGFVEGIALGILYELFCNNNNKGSADEDTVNEGFLYGHKEIIFCCESVF